MRLGLAKSNLNGKSSAMDVQLMGARLDYFNAPSSSWKPAVEDAELSVASRHRLKHSVSVAMTRPLIPVFVAC